MRLWTVNSGLSTFIDFLALTVNDQEMAYECEGNLTFSIAIIVLSGGNSQ